MLRAMLIGLLLLAPAAEARPTLHVGSSLRAVEATPGSGCSELCTDAAYPLALKGTLDVHRGNRIAFDFSQAIRSLSVSTPHGPIAVRPAMGRDWAHPHWSGRLPASLPEGALRVSVTARFDGGDQHFEAGLNVLPRPPARSQVPRLIGLSGTEAKRRLERRGLRWRVTPQGRLESETPPPLAPGTRIHPDPDADTVRRQSVRAGQTVRRGTLVTLETKCSLLRFVGRGCL